MGRRDERIGGSDGRRGQAGQGQDGHGSSWVHHLWPLLLVDGYGSDPTAAAPRGLRNAAVGMRKESDENNMSDATWLLGYETGYGSIPAFILQRQMTRNLLAKIASGGLILYP